MQQEAGDGASGELGAVAIFTLFAEPRNMIAISPELAVFIAFLVGVSIYSAKSSAERSRERQRTAERNTINSMHRAYDAGMRLAENHATQMALLTRELSTPRPMPKGDAEGQDEAGTER